VRTTEVELSVHTDVTVAGPEAALVDALRPRPQPPPPTYKILSGNLCDVDRRPLPVPEVDMGGYRKESAGPISGRIARCAGRRSSSESPRER